MKWLSDMWSGMPVWCKILVVVVPVCLVLMYVGDPALVPGVEL